MKQQIVLSVTTALPCFRSMVAHGGTVVKAPGATRFLVKILRKTTRGAQSLFQVGSLPCPPAPPRLKENFKGDPPRLRKKNAKANQ